MDISSQATSETIVKPPAPGGTAAELSAAAERAGKKLRNAGIVAVLLVLIGVVVGVVPRWLRRAELRIETRDLAVPTVMVISPVPGPAAAGLSLPAEIKPLVEAPIYARASGYLKRWLVDIGAQVKEGELLAEIDSPELNQELAQARAQLNQTEASLGLAKVTATRWADLLKTSSVSEQEAAEKQADLELKTANVQAAEANVRRLEESQRFEKVIAPFAGIITARRTDVGELIARDGGKELFRLAQMSTLRVYVRVPQAAARFIQPGQGAELLFPDLPGRSFQAQVVRTSGMVSADSRTLLTELSVDNSRGEILAGSFAQVRFADLKQAPSLTLPSNALLFRAEGPQAGVVRSDHTVELRNVSVGRDFGPTVEILSGLSPQDQVILNPSDSLVAGITVRLQEAAATNSAAK